MNNVELLVEAEDVPPEIELIAEYAEKILKKIGVEDWQMGLLFTDDQGIREYNSPLEGDG